MTSKNTEIPVKLPKPLYETEMGRAYVGDARDLLPQLADETFDLVLTSPPFALQRQKEYGNEDQTTYADWLLGFCRDVYRVLRPTGSFVLDLGGAYKKGRPVRSLYNYQVLIRLCSELNFQLAEEFFWYNPAKLPSPIEWVNKRKIRAKDAVNTVWWLSKTDYPKADIRRVLVPYSDRMRKLLKDAERYYTPKKRPSGHDISGHFAQFNEGAIPSNLLEIPNTESNSSYLRLCKLANVEAHPARFPERLPAFFISFLTDPNDLVLDLFAGSNTTGAAAERVRRGWIAFDSDADYLAASVFRFAEHLPDDKIMEVYQRLRSHPEAAVRIEAPAQAKMGFALTGSE
jgi:site-specific DNA-methyltransferase (cytosine-N4-specific)